MKVMMIPSDAFSGDVNPLVICDSLLLKMAIEIVDIPIENGDRP